MIVSFLIAIIIIAGIGLCAYELLKPTPPRHSCTWRPTVDAPGDNHATPDEGETEEPAKDLEATDSW